MHLKPPLGIHLLKARHCVSTSLHVSPSSHWQGEGWGLVL